MQVEIKVLNQFYSKILRGVNHVKPCLSFKSEYHRQGQYRKIRKEFRKSLIDYRNGNVFLTGLIPRVTNFCNIHGIPLRIDDYHAANFKLGPTEWEPKIDGIDIRNGKWSYQYDFIMNAIKDQRGIIKSATGSGKTIMMIGIISCFPQSKILFLSNTYVPITQFRNALIKYDMQKYHVTSSTIQSFYKKSKSEYQNEYDIIIIDECHEGCRSDDGMYAKVLKNSNAIIRLGFTATLPDAEGDQLIMEGLLGPVICELPINEGIKIGVLAKPILKIKSLIENKNLKTLTWREAYSRGVVNNRALNMMIIEDALEDVSEDNSVLILVKELDHGRNIVDMAKRLYDFDMVFVYGKTGAEIRENIRQEMINKKRLCVVASAVFKKALDIPNLGSVINGAGGKVESGTIQAVGRGARRPEGKETFKIRDYFIPGNRYLVEHFGYRLVLYFKEGWL